MSMVRAGNAQLENRYKNRYGYQYDHCPHCILNGITKKLKESHVILSCPSVDMERRKMRVTNYIIKLKSHGKTTNQEILRSYLGGDGANTEILLHRGKCMSKIIETWICRNHEQHAGVRHEMAMFMEWYVACRECGKFRLKVKGY